MRNTCRLLTIVLLAQGVGITLGQETRHPFLSFVQDHSSRMRAGDLPPPTLEAWREQRERLREKLLQAWGGFPKEHVPLIPRVLGTLQRDGYRVEKVVFQTLPEVWMTANTYVPDGPGRRAAVLCVHGHWPGAKQDPHVQARCIGLAKLGFFVLAVDAMGAGERGMGTKLGEYHGEMVAATLWPTGQPLSGLQVYENMRAVDYLVSRPEVDAQRIGITGASGGGNQTMYAGAWDDRFRAVVPVCSVGTYQAYLGAACCMCEVVPGGLAFTEEGAVLGLVAPRALMVVSATKDAFQFSVGEAAKSVAAARPLFELYQAGEKLRHVTVDSPHDYNQPMREAMYGWMTLHLKGEGDGSPVPEPNMQVEEPETLRCYPGTTRPGDWLTLPQIANRLAGALVAAQTSRHGTSAAFVEEPQRSRQRFDQFVLGQTNPYINPGSIVYSADAGRVNFESDPGIRLTMELTHFERIPNGRHAIVLIVTHGDESQPELQVLKNAASAAGSAVAILHLRATGGQAWPSDTIGRAPDHNTAEWSLWIGRPLLGQWVQDVRTALSVLEQGHGRGKDLQISVAGMGPAGVVALSSGAIDDRIDQVVTIKSLASFLTDKPYEKQRLGTLPNGVLRDVGDIPRIAMLVAPRKLSIIAPVNAQGEALTSEAMNRAFEVTTARYAAGAALDSLRLAKDATSQQLEDQLK